MTRFMPATKKKAGLTRSFWLKQLHRWHWISAALSLVGMLLFAITGITLNHAADIEASPTVTEREARLPPPLLKALPVGGADKAPLPEQVGAWLDKELSVSAAGREAEWSDDEIYLALPRPGGDGWLSIDRATGDVVMEETDRGWVSWLNDLHKGRNTGRAWFWFIDIFAVACVIFTITGLFLLQLHAKHRPATWPTVGLGFILPLLLIILFMH